MAAEIDRKLAVLWNDPPVLNKRLTALDERTEGPGGVHDCLRRSRMISVMEMEMQRDALMDMGREMSTINVFLMAYNDATFRLRKATFARRIDVDKKAHIL